MKKIMAAISIIVFASLFPFQTEADSIIKSNVDQATNRVITTWKRGEQRSLEKAVDELMVAEAYLLTKGKKAVSVSYLAHVPENISDNPRSVAAYIWLIQQDREQFTLWPKSFFSGKEFSIEYKTSPN